VIGYIGRISTRDVEKLEEKASRRTTGHRLHRQGGLEASYQDELHGTTGFEQVEIDAAGRGIRTLSRTPAQPGNNVTLSIDIKLQQSRNGSSTGGAVRSVAIEPGTGSVLAFVSSPGSIRTCSSKESTRRTGPS
jgi:penicillin-binding protein 2